MSLLKQLEGLYSEIPEGIQEGIAGSISGLIVQAVLIWYYWGEYDILFFAFGVLIMICMAISTLFTLKNKKNGFQIGFILGSLVFL